MVLCEEEMTSKVSSWQRGTSASMFDTLAVAQQLAAGGVARDQAEVIAKAIHDGLDHGNHVTSDQFRAGLAEVRAEIANLDTRLSTDIAGRAHGVRKPRAGRLQDRHRQEQPACPGPRAAARP